MKTNAPKKVLSVFSLAMINIIAVDNLRSLPIAAEYGLSLVFFYLLAAILFFIPTALVAAELATGWPNKGGVYVWVREAFGKKWALLAIWLQWIYNVVWYPTMMAFLAGVLAYAFFPSLVNNKFYVLTAVLVMFWLATLVNSFGMKSSSWFSNLGAIIGTIVPMVFIIILGIYWYWQGKTSQLNYMSYHSFFPDLHNWENLSFLVAVLFGLIGMEMSAVHAEEVKNPQRDYPKALFYSAIIILATLILAALAIADVIPHGQINLVVGMMQAFSDFFKAFHMNWLMPVLGILVIIGGLSGVSAWVIGPTKGLLVASEDGSIPEIFQKTNKYGAPNTLLIAQGIIVTVLSAIFLFMPTVSASYWVLSALTAQLALLFYIFLFAAVIKLRYSQPDKPRAYKIPGGKPVLWLVAGVGILTSVAVIIFGFFPPNSIDFGGVFRYEAILILGCLLFCLVPFIVLYFKKH